GRFPSRNRLSSRVLAPRASKPLNASASRRLPSRLGIYVHEYLSYSSEHRVPHRARELAGVRVLPARMVGRDEPRAVRQRRDRAVGKRGPLSRGERRPPTRRLEPALVCDATERHHHPAAREQPQLGREERPAAPELRPARLVARRRAPHGGNDVAVGELETVVACARSRGQRAHDTIARLTLEREASMDASCWRIPTLKRGLGNTLPLRVASCRAHPSGWDHTPVRCCVCLRCGGLLEPDRYALVRR